MNKTDIIRKVKAKLAEKEVENLVQKIIKNTEFAGKVFSVGGFVRDELLGVPSKDLDIVIEMEGGAEKLTKFLNNKFTKETSNPRNLGKSYPIWGISFKENVIHDGKEYKTKGAEIEVADTQKESFPDDKSRQRVTEPGTLEEDIARRDFTVNMLLRDLTNGEIKDLTGTSKEDLKKGILRGHPKVPLTKTFSDDPLRMLRLVRFQVKYDWDIPLPVLRDVKKSAERIKIVSAERVTGELTKIMKLGKLAKAIKIMKAIGLLKHILPEVDALRDVEQSPEHHFEGDALKHTIKVLENAKPTVEAQLAALLHDVGKKDTKGFDEIKKRITFHDHEKVSGEIAEAILRRLKFDTATIKKVRKMIEFHMRAMSWGKWKDNAIRRFIRETGEELEDILDLVEADSLGSHVKKDTPGKNTMPELRNKIKEILKIPVRKNSVLNGLEVMHALGIKSGPPVGKAMKILIDIEDDFAGKGKKLDKETAIKELKKIYKED